MPYTADLPPQTLQNELMGVRLIHITHNLHNSVFVCVCDITKKYEVVTKTYNSVVFGAQVRLHAFSRSGENVLPNRMAPHKGNGFYIAMVA